MDFGHVKKETISRFPQVSKKYFNPHSDEENGCSKNGGIQNKKKKKKNWEFLFSNGITITIKYVPSALNKSSHKLDCSEWLLNKNSLQHKCFK